MIAGTPVLDIKPYIPEYDCPINRKDVGSESYDLNTDQPQETTVPLNEKMDKLNLQTDSEPDDRTDDDGLGGFISENVSEADAPVTESSQTSVQFSLPEHVNNVLEDIKAYVTQGDLCQVDCESKDQDSPKTKPLEMTGDHPCYGEEAYSTIAGWLREPPVGSLEVRFTPHAEKELAQFLPTQLSGTVSLQYTTCSNMVKL